MSIVSNPAALQIIVIILAVIALLLVTHFRAVKIGEKKNGYVTDSLCDKKMNKFEKWFKDLNNKVDRVVKCVAKVEGYIDAKKEL